jgi:hypothetical protein
MEIVFTRDKLELFQEAAVSHYIQHAEEVKTFL